MVNPYGSYLGPTRGMNPMAAPQPLTRGEIIAAGLMDIGMAMQGQPGTHLPQLKYTQQLAMHNAMERERLKRKEEREEEDIRLKREAAEEAKRSREQMAGYARGLFGEGIDTSVPVSGTVEPSPYPIAPPMTPEGEYDLEAIQANPDQWEMREVDGRLEVIPKGPIAPVPPAVQTPGGMIPAPAQSGVTPRKLRTMGQYHLIRGDREKASGYFKEARDMEDQQMQIAANRREATAHRKRMAEPVGTQSIRWVEDLDDPGEPLMMRFNNKTGEPEVATERGWENAVGRRLKPLAEEVRRGPIVTSTENKLQGQLESLAAINDIIDLSLARLSETDFSLIGQGRLFAQDIKGLSTTMKLFIQEISDDALANRPPPGEKYDYQKKFGIDVGLSTKQTLMNTLAYAWAKARDEDGKISDKDFQAAAEAIGDRPLGTYADFRAITDLIKEQGELKRRRIRGRLRDLDTRRMRRMGAVPVEIPMEIKDLPGAQQLQDGRWTAPDPNNPNNRLIEIR